MDKDNSIALSLNSVDWRNKKTNPQPNSTKQERQNPEKWDELTCHRIKGAGARQLKPVNQAMVRKVICLTHSIAIFTAAVLTQGTNAKAKINNAPNNEK